VLDAPSTDGSPGQEKLPVPRPLDRQLVSWRPQKQVAGPRMLLVGFLSLLLLLMGLTTWVMTSTRMIGDTY